MLIRTALATLLLAAAPIKVSSDRSIVTGASSGQGASTALSLSNGAVLYQDAKHRWHRFRAAKAVRFARLDDGAGLAAWESDGSVFVREWHRNGRLDPPQALLNGIEKWAMGADRRGTVVLAAIGAGNAVYATLRDPGGTFGPVQQLQPPQPPAQYPFSWTPAISPIAEDGTVTISWPFGSATRRGGGTRFGAGQPPAALPAGKLVVDDNPPVTEGPKLRALCSHDCSDARLFVWGSLREVVVDHAGAWYAAKRYGTRYDRPTRVSVDGSAFPVWTAKRGVLAFTRQKRGVYLVPTR